MSKEIEVIYRNGQLELPPDVHLPENSRVTVIVPDSALANPADDPAYSIPELAEEIGPEDLAQNLGHYLYGHPKQV
jgi:predicted DNA-binding antitoxin AbrB/MazE fold protein